MRTEVWGTFYESESFCYVCCIHLFLWKLCLLEWIWSLAFFYGHIYIQQQAALHISLPVFCPNFVVIMQYSRFPQQLCWGFTSSGKWHCVTGARVCRYFKRLNAFEISGNTTQQPIGTLFYSLVFMVLNQVLLAVYFPLYVWYPGAVLIFNHFFFFCAAILAFMKNRKFKCSFAVWLSSHHCTGVPWCWVK